MMHKIASTVVTILLIGFLLIAVKDMPEFGSELSPVNNEVSEKYINDSLEEVGAINIVASMILDYRAFDTFVETSVIFTSLIAVMAILKRSGTRYED